MSSLYAIHSLQIYQLMHSSQQNSEPTAQKVFSLAPPRTVFCSQHGAVREGRTLVFCHCHCMTFSTLMVASLLETHHDLCNPMKDPGAEANPWLQSPDNRDLVRCGHEQLCHWGEERGLCRLLCSNYIASQPIYSVILTAMEDTLLGCPTWGTQLAMKEGEEQQR